MIRLDEALSLRQLFLILLLAFFFSLGVWAFAHQTAKPGTPVKVAFGLVEYTKKAAGDYAGSAEHERVQVTLNANSPTTVKTKSTPRSNEEPHPLVAISEEINAALPYLKNKVSESYIGTEVVWEGWVNTLYFHNDGQATVQLRGYADKHRILPTFDVTVDIDKSPGVKRMKAHDRVVVKGTVSMVRYGEAELKGASFVSYTSDITIPGNHQ